MIDFVLVNKDKVRVDKNKYNINSFESNFTGNVGVLIPADCVVIDVDCVSDVSKHYIEWIKGKYPNIFITKTVKDGGYHLWFKTKDKIKRNTGNLTAMFGWKFDILTGVKNYVILPDNFSPRKYLTHFKSFKDLAEGWESYDVYLKEEDIFKLTPYLYKTSEHQTPLTLKDGGRNSGLLEWLGFCASQGIHPDLMKEFTDVLSKITTLDKREIESTILSSLSRYSEQELKNNISTNGNIIPNFYGEALPDLQQQLVGFVKERELFAYDESTGIYCCNLDEHKGKIISQKDFIDLMQLYFAKRLYYVNRDSNGIRKSVSEVNSTDRAVLFKTIAPYITFNSRRLIYDNIPEWDGVERINSFMRDFYECETNPNFTWLLLTSIVGMMKDPNGCYCPYFFDFVGHKGVGKTLLPMRLVGDYFAFMQFGRSYDDMFVNLYNANAIIAIDDECVMVSDNERSFNKLSYDQFKQFVTAKVDRFSRKNAQPETHTRSFIIVRTSNERKTGYAMDERRQIIFESNLPPNGCRIKPDDLPDSFFKQLLAEAKLYYDRYGRYILTDEDWGAVAQQQIDSFDTENTNYVEIEQYIDWCITKVESGVRDSEDCFIRDNRFKSGVIINWNTYNSWCRKSMSKAMSSKIFWNGLHGVAAKTGKILFDTKKRIKHKSEVIRYAELVSGKKSAREEVVVEEVKTYKVTSVKELMKQKLQGNTIKSDSGVKFSKIAEELGAVKHSYNDEDTFMTNELLSFCPKNVRELFLSNKDNASALVPTTLNVNNLDITYGLGGLHGAIKNYNGENLWLLDVQSMYPNIMLNWNLQSRNISDMEIYRGWVEERQRLKQLGDPKSDELKLKINSVYGLMKADWCALYDPRNCTSIAVLGQIIMTILITGLQEKGCQIVNANTDGVIIKTPTDNDWQNVCKVWESKMNLKLNKKEIKELEQADVNNYVAKFSDGETVRKGAKYKL